jgi:hypothetical protein
MLKKALPWGGGLSYEKVVERVSILFQVEKEYLTGRERQKDWVQAVLWGSWAKKTNMGYIRFNITG